MNQKLINYGETTITSRGKGKKQEKNKQNVRTFLVVYLLKGELKCENQPGERNWKCSEALRMKGSFPGETAVILLFNWHAVGMPGHKIRVVLCFHFQQSTRYLYNYSE